MKIKQSILIVDDEPRNIRILEEILSEDFNLIKAKLGHEALDMLKHYQPDLILLDIMMPDISGYEVCKIIRSNPENKFIRIILVSGKAMVEERLEGYKAGADAYITKPFAPEELLAKASVFLKLARVEREIHALNLELEEKVRLRSEQLTKVERAAFIGMHTAEIAHDMNSPLTAIRIYISILEKKYPDEVTLQSISKAVEKINSIMRSILEGAREGNDQLVSDFSINEVIKVELKLFQLDTFFKTQVTLETSLQEIPLFHGQVLDFNRCFSNLIKNAVDALHGRDIKTLKISTQQIGDSIIIKFEDSGCGIKPESLEKIFEPFFTTKSLLPTDNVPTGTGLGLPSVKRMLEGYGGNIQFVSELGIGTTVTVKIPLH